MTKSPISATYFNFYLHLSQLNDQKSTVFLEFVLTFLNAFFNTRIIAHVYAQYIECKDVWKI